MMSKEQICEVCNAPIPDGHASRACPQCGAVIGGARLDGSNQQIVTSQEARLEATASLPTAPRTNDQADASDIGFAIPGYDLLREINRGGQGVVYQALQLSTKRKVAIKVLLEGHFASRASRKRFEREIELVASLKHPNIIAVFDSGVAPDGHPYYVMDYVRGLPITQYVRGQQLVLDDALRLFALVAGAVSHAHHKGIIHRDLKPSNILIDADGAPRILDFGLAKTLTSTDESVFSLTGQVVGTLPYMSPEQTAGNPDAIDTRTDVYSLGVILYEMLTGRSPYPVSGTLAEIIRNITETEPVPLARAWSADQGIRASVARSNKCPLNAELQTIADKALAKSRERRYQSAGELARDINNYLTGAPLDAKRDSALYLLSKALKRNRVPVAIATAFAVLIVGSLIALSILYSQQGQLLAQVKNEQRVAEAAESDARAKAIAAETAANEEARARQAADLQQRLTKLALARADVELKDFPAARKILVETAVPPDLADDWRWTAWSYLHSSREIVRKDLVPWFPADERAMLARGEYRGDRILLDLEHQRVIVQAFAASHPNGDFFAIDLADGQIRPVEISSRRPLHFPGIQVDDASKLPSVSAGPLALDDSTFLGIDKDKNAVVITRSGKPATIPPFTQEPSACASSHDGKIVAIGFRTGRIDGFSVGTSLTGTPTLDTIFSIPGYRESIASLAFSPDGRQIHAISDGMIYRAWLREPTPDLARLQGHSNTVRHIAFSPDGRLVATGGYDGHVKVFAVKSHALINDIAAHLPSSPNFGTLTFFPDSRHLLTSGSDSMNRIWDLSSADLARPPDQARGPITGILTDLVNLTRSQPAAPTLNSPLSEFPVGHTSRGQLSRDGATLFTTNGFAFLDNTKPHLEQWNLSDPTNPRKVADFGTTPSIYMAYNLRYIDGQRRLLTVNSALRGGDEHLACQIYDTSTTPPTPGIILDDGPVDHRDLDISPDGSLLALSTWQGTVSLWDWRQQKRLAVLDVNPGRTSASIVSSVHFHPRLPLLATACHDSRVNLFSTQTFRKLATIDVDPERKLAFGAYGPLKEAVFSPDGKTLAIGAGNDLWLVDLTLYDAQIAELTKERDALATNARGESHESDGRAH
jgi:serine/threonine protein kinase/WD40 repeat protein